MKKSSSSVCLMLLFASLIIAEPFNLSLKPEFQIPIGPTLDNGTAYYSLGFGALLEGQFTLKSVPWLVLGFQGEVEILPINSGTESFIYMGGGFISGYKFSPFTRSTIRLWGGGGAATGMISSLSSFSPYITAGADFSFKLSPSLALSAGARYLHGFSSAGTLYNGIGVNVGISYNFSSGGGRADLKITPEIPNIYPLYYTYYDKSPAGELFIKNNEMEDIKNIRVKFFVPEYMNQAKYSDVELPVLKSGEEASIPVLALFTKDIFEITEGLKVSSDITVEYDYYGKTRSSVVPYTISINNRNAMTWDDDRKAASFVTLNNPIIKSYARGLAGEIRGDKLPSLNTPFQIGMGLFESLTMHNIGYVPDPSSSYADMSEQIDMVDFIQFPQETLAYKAGDCDDITVLYASMLEASGIATAFITTPGHIFLAFDLEMSEDRAKRNFPRPEDLYYMNDTAWVPVEVTLVEQGFLKAWQIGAREIREAGDQTGFYPVREAWQTFPAAEYASTELVYLPNPLDVSSKFNSELRRFLRREITPVIAKIQKNIDSGTANPRLMNRMGITYARFGFLEEAEEWFNKALVINDFVPSLLNMGNVLYLKEEPLEASVYFKKALINDPENTQALIGLARVSYEIEDNETANASLAALEKIDPEAAGSVAYLGSATVRASAAMDREIYDWGEE